MHGPLKAAATPDSCPPDLRSAATDPVWAKGIYDNLPDWQSRGSKTTGWFFADGSATKTLLSGEGGRDNPDELWTEAKRLLAEAPIAHRRGEQLIQLPRMTGA